VPELATPLWLLSHRDLCATARMRAFREVLADAVLARRELLEGRKERGAPPARATRPGTPRRR
jgi:hypothetical protein